jgi:isopentenyl-diphosphate delta-isomerase
MGNLRTHARINYVNDDDIILGVTDRAALPDKPANFRVVHILVFDRVGRILLQRIAPKQRSSGLLGSSVAGYVLANEDYREAAVRKAREELGVRAFPRWIGKTTMPDLGATKFIGVYVANADGPFQPDTLQVASVGFHELDAVVTEVKTFPERYTSTFRHVFSYFLAQRA